MIAVHRSKHGHASFSDVTKLCRVNAALSFSREKFPDFRS
jgi:hypothetical protein